MSSQTGFSRWLTPRGITRRARVLAWLSLVSEIVIVGTGGSVRLTASGLGCPTWPQCTPGSLVPTEELGFHAIVEFSNRMMSGVVAIVALLTFLFLVRTRKTRPELFWLSFSLGVLVLVQAGIGGIAVLSELQSYIVGLHFVISALMVVLAACLVWFIYRVDAAPRAPAWLTRLTAATAAVLGVAVVVGVLTTGAGPHAGDSDPPTNGRRVGACARLARLSRLRTHGAHSHTRVASRLCDHPPFHHRAVGGRAGPDRRWAVPGTEWSTRSCGRNPHGARLRAACLHDSSCVVRSTPQCDEATSVSLVSYFIAW